MDDLTSLKDDIESGVCTLISSFNQNGMVCRIVAYKGLLFKLFFSKVGEILSCDTSDKNFNFDQFVDIHGKNYEFTHMLFMKTHHFIYVKPVDVRPWMRRSFNIEVPAYWCIHRHFTLLVAERLSSLHETPLREYGGFQRQQTEITYN